MRSAVGSALFSHPQLPVNELLTVEGLGKRFKRRRVLEDISFSLRAGEGLGLIGPNAAGKTTPFECLAGLLAADAGTVTHREKTLPPQRRKEVLFYLPDGIVPWERQTVGWLLAWSAGLLAVVLWVSYGGHVYAPETVNLFLGHLLRATLSCGVAVGGESEKFLGASAISTTLR